MSQNDSEYTSNSPAETAGNLMPVYPGWHMEDDSINLMHVFSNMKKYKSIFVRVLVMFIIIGMAVPLLMYQFNQKDDTMVSLITFTYEGAEDGKTPDDGQLDVLSSITSSYVLTEALKHVSLSKSLSYTDLAANITVKGVLTDQSRQQLELLNSLGTDDKTALAQLQELELEYTNQYLVILENEFGKDKVKLTSRDMSNLLLCITDAYQDYFYDTYATITLPMDSPASINVEDYDFMLTLELLSSTQESLKTYCEDLLLLYPQYRGKEDGLSFQDLLDVVEIMESGIQNTYSYVYLKAISKDSVKLVTQYSYNKRQLELQLQVTQANLVDIDAEITNYENTKLVVVSGDNSQTVSSTFTTDYYNNLVLNKVELAEEEASLKRQISDLEDKITRFSTPSSTESIASVQAEVETIYNDSVAVYDLIVSHAEEIVKSDTTKTSYMNVIEVTEEGDSITSSIKGICIGIAVGAVLALGIWFVVAFLDEAKSQSEKKNGEVI